MSGCYSLPLGAAWPCASSPAAAALSWLSVSQAGQRAGAIVAGTVWWLPLLMVLLVILVAPVRAQVRDDAVLTLASVRAVTATSDRAELPLARVFSSVDVLGAELLSDRHVAHSWELFSRAPGVQVTNFGMGTDAGRISFRGFNGEGRVNAVKLLIDGVPSNDNAGGMPYLDAVFPLDIDAIEIVRGTNDPRYGLNAIAGDVNVVTRQGGNDGVLSVGGGSFGTRELQLAKGIERGAWSQNYSVAWRGSDGYRDHAGAVQRKLSGKWFYADPKRDWRAGLSMRYYHNRADEAGYLTDEQARQAPRRSPDFAAADRGARRILQGALHLDGRIGAELSWSATTYVNRYRNSRFVRFSEAGAQQLRNSDETHHGVLANGAWRAQRVGSLQLTLEAGVDAQWQDNLSQRWRTQQRQRGALLRDWDYTLDTHGGYLQAIVAAGERLQLVPAYRIDRIDGRFNDLASGRRYPVYDYGMIRQPKFSVAYRLLGQSTLYGNWGRSFQIGSGNGAYRTGINDLAPSINEGWEAGFKFRPWSRAEARLAYWQQRASGEVATVLGVAGSVAVSDVGNVGRTLRRGWDAQLNLQGEAQWRGWLAVSRQQATIVTPPADAPSTRGRQIENVPRWLANAGLEWQASARLRLTAWGSAQGDYYLERSNTLPRSGGYVLLNLGARWSADADDEWTLQLSNVADRRYSYAWYDSGASGYSPGDGRALYLGWTRRF